MNKTKCQVWSASLISTRDGHADADIRINFRIIRQYRAISDIFWIYLTYASMRIGKYIRMAIPNRDAFPYSEQCNLLLIFFKTFRFILD